MNKTSNEAFPETSPLQLSPRQRRIVFYTTAPYHPRLVRLVPCPWTTITQSLQAVAARCCARLYASLDLLQTVVRMERESRISVPRGCHSICREGQVELVLAPLEAQEKRRSSTRRGSARRGSAKRRSAKRRSAACGADTGFVCMTHWVFAVDSSQHAVLPLRTAGEPRTVVLR